MDPWYNTYMRVPFKDKGRDASGCDCWGLVRLIYKERLGVTLPSYDNLYESAEQRTVVGEAVTNHLADGWVKVATPEAYDLIVMDMVGIPMHVGVITHTDHMLHCLKGKGTIHENTTTLRWKHKIRGYYRWKG